MITDVMSVSMTLCHWALRCHVSERWCYISEYCDVLYSSSFWPMILGYVHNPLLPGACWIKGLEHEQILWAGTMLHADCVFISQHASVDDGRSEVPSRSVRSARCKNSSASGTDESPHVGNYRLLKTIGKGNFAKVKLARHIPTGWEVRWVPGTAGKYPRPPTEHWSPVCVWQVAIKIIDKTQLNPSSLQKVSTVTWQEVMCSQVSQQKLHWNGSNYYYLERVRLKQRTVFLGLPEQETWKHSSGAGLLTRCWSSRKNVFLICDSAIKSQPVLCADYQTCGHRSYMRP